MNTCSNVNVNRQPQSHKIIRARLPVVINIKYGNVIQYRRNQNVQRKEIDKCKVIKVSVNPLTPTVAICVQL